MFEEKLVLDLYLHTQNNFKLLFEDTTLNDVTLVSEDHQQLHAHKIILSTGSQFVR